MPQLTPANYSNKPAPILADIIPLVDSQNGNAVRTITIANLISIIPVVSDATKLNLTGGTLTGNVFNTSTGFLQYSVGTTAQRPTTPLDGMVRFNATTLRTEFYSNGNWRNHARLDGDTFTGTIIAPQIASPVQTLTPTGTTQTINLNLGSVIYLNLASATGNVTLTIQNATAGATYLITVIQGATARTLIFPTGTRQTAVLTSNNVVANSRFKIAMDFDGTNFDANINLNLFV